ncbi:MAG TPA: hypothetical protein DEB35_01465 [Desulfuromonas sp.]|nr:hypothetical protein [Desulfuromonas sp.]
MKENKLQSFLDDIHELPDFASFDEITIYTKNCLGETPLHFAAIRGDVEAVEALIKAGADINAQGEHHYSPLHEAVEQGHPEVVRLLIGACARKDLKDSDGATPVELAELLGNQEIIRLLGRN